MSEPDTESEPAPWAMQLAARVEKVDPPGTADICAAAALAAIGVVSHENAASDGPWSIAIESWAGGGKIRKLVRRARGAAWERAQRPSGVTATVGRAEVRAYVPCQMDQVPDEVAALQIRSTELDQPERVDSIAAITHDQATTMPPMMMPSMMVIALTPAAQMSWGKQAAQSAHAGQILWRDTEAAARVQWVDAGRSIRVVHPTESLWTALLETAPAQVHDGGYTEVAPGTLTAVAFWAPNTADLPGR